MPDFWNIAGFTFGVVGIAVALYQGFERKKLKHFVRAQAWYMYAKANNLTGIVQAATRAYRSAHSSGIDAEVLSLLAKSDAFGLELLRETARHIQLSEPRFDSVALQHWETSGKVASDHLIIFQQLFVEEVPKTKDGGGANQS